MPMTSLDREWRDLAKADRHIIEGEERVTRQQLLVEQLRAHGHGDMAAEGEKLLTILAKTLEEWRGHREQILAEIARHEARGPSTAG
jgi:hypothetical protein